MNLRKQVILAVATVAFMNAGVGHADSVSVTATLTADNHYVLYYGTKDANTLKYVGQNEVNDVGSSEGYAWTDPEIWNFTVDRGNYLYVLGWSDDETAQGWLGQFDYGYGPDVYSNKTDWEYFSTGADKDPGCEWQDTDEQTGLRGFIQNANAGNPSGWSSVQYSLPNGSGPWGNYPQISEYASWIWGTPLQGGGFAGEYFIFRTKVDPVPEPATMLLMGLGLAGLTGFRIKRKSH